MDGDAVILIVGPERHSQSLLASALAELGGAAAPEPETTAAGVRIFAANASRPAVIDTTPLPRAVAQDGALKSARRWISENSLRRLLFGKLVFLVCVVGGPAADTRVEEFCWLDTLDLMFADHKRGMKTVVDSARSPGANIRFRIKNALESRGFPSGNMSYVDLAADAPLAAKSLLENELTRREIFESPRSPGEEAAAAAAGAVTPFEVSDWDKSDGRQQRTGPWEPERVILFGKSGSGKSTLAQMLTAGRLDPASGKFPASSSVRGETREVSRGAGRGWYVVDTPGFGEPRGAQSTVPTREAERRLKRFVRRVEGSYAHFLFVIHRDRIDELEVRLWKFFVLIFGADIGYHFSVVVSNADSAWVADNLAHLRDNFRGCKSFLGAEFPSVQTEDEEWESELAEVRRDSLREFENALAGLARNETACRLGEYSETAVDGRKANLYGRSGIAKKTAGVAKRTYFELFFSLAKLANCLTVKDDIILLPK